MSPPQITVDVALCLLRNSDTNFLIGYQNSIPDPRYLTFDQRKDITPAVLGSPEPHKFVYFHFRKVDGGVRSKQIIMHRYPNACNHDWNNQDDINKLNVFRIAAVTLAMAGIDVSVGEKCYSVIPKSLKRMWFPNLVEFVEERRAEFARYLVEATIDQNMTDGDDGDDGDDEDDEDDGDDRDNGDDADNGISPRHPDEHKIVTDIAEAHNDVVHLVCRTTQTGAENLEGHVAVDSTDDDDLSSDGVRDRQALRVYRAYHAARTALSSSSYIPVEAPIQNPALSSASTNIGSPIPSPFIGSPITGPQPLSLPAEVESLNLDDLNEMSFELEHSVNNEVHGGISLL